MVDRPPGGWRETRTARVGRVALARQKWMRALRVERAAWAEWQKAHTRARKAEDKYLDVRDEEV